MNNRTYPPQDSNENLDYMIDWSLWLQGDTITASAWLISPSGLTEGTKDKTTTTTTIWLSGGIPGTQYRLVNRISTAASRIKEQEVIVWIT